MKTKNEIKTYIINFVAGLNLTNEFEKWKLQNK